jgi:hypothetical protein
MLINHLNHNLPKVARQSCMATPVTMAADLQRVIEVSVLKDIEKLVNFINDIKMVEQFFIQYQIAEYPD